MLTSTFDTPHSFFTPRDRRMRPVHQAAFRYTRKRVVRVPIYGHLVQVGVVSTLSRFPIRIILESLLVRTEQQQIQAH